MNRTFRRCSRLFGGGVTLVAAGLLAAALVQAPAAVASDAPGDPGMVAGVYVWQRPNWCEPAAAATVLRLLGVRVTQDQAAAVMDVNQHPTRVNVWLRPRGLVMVTQWAHDAATLRREAGSGRPVLVAVWGYRLPWDSRRYSVRDGGHAIVLLGVTTFGARVWDPARHDSGGFHVVSFGALAAAAYVSYPIVRRAE